MNKERSNTFVDMWVDRILIDTIKWAQRNEAALTQNITLLNGLGWQYEAYLRVDAGVHRNFYIKQA